jgi:hypothetical protein
MEIDRRNEELVLPPLNELEEFRMSAIRVQEVLELCRQFWRSPEGKNIIQEQVLKEIRASERH